MKRLASFCVMALIFVSVAFSQDQVKKPDRAPLLLVQQIPLPNVGGRIDHFRFDGKRKRVIGAALGNNTVEIVDTFAGRDIHSISGAKFSTWLTRIAVHEALARQRRDNRYQKF